MTVFLDLVIAYVTGHAWKITERFTCFASVLAQNDRVCNPFQLNSLNIVNFLLTVSLLYHKIQERYMIS